jgi:hypothetical protein
MKILEISKIISTQLNIDYESLEKIIMSNLSEEQLALEFDDKLMLKINDLLEKDLLIYKFGETEIKKESTKIDFIKLKNSLGKLQILVLINNLKKSKNCNDVLKSFMNIFNKKIETVNEILANDLLQTGGNNIYYNKYLKYKINYLNLKYNTNNF